MPRSVEKYIRGYIDGGPHLLSGAEKCLRGQIASQSHLVSEPFRYWIQNCEIRILYLNFWIGSQYSTYFAIITVGSSLLQEESMCDLVSSVEKLFSRNDVVSIIRPGPREPK